MRFQKMQKKSPLYIKILKGILYLLLIFFLYQAVIYFLSPVYHFPQPKPFSGDLLYNPYQGMDSSQWRKANLHYHSRAWGGITSGRNNTYEAFYGTYKALGYDAPQISNYQSIDTHYKDSAFYIPGYEHGIGVRKKHQILIGARRVLWLDYSLFQDLSHKQHIINLLRPDNEIVGIAHPGWEGGYTVRDMQYLTNYDLVEALDHNWRSLPQWDAALSAGKPVFVLSDDDAHNIFDPFEIQRNCTYINSPEVERSALVKALKEGKAFGAEIYMGNWEKFAEKAKNARDIPILNSVKLNRDTLWVCVTGRPFKITFIGQGGEPRKITRLANRAFYKFRKEDTYIRTEITFLTYFDFPKVGPGTIFYLNPVFRYNGIRPENRLAAEINIPGTWIQRILGFGTLLALLALWFYYRKRIHADKS